MICTVHMFCAIFTRLLAVLESIVRLSTAEDDKILKTVNDWFQNNHFFIEFKAAEDMIKRGVIIVQVLFIFLGRWR